jgi:ClpA/ClpB-like protein
MTEFPVPLDNLITYVKALHPDGGPLENVADAFAVSARLDEQSDALIGYFVDQARKSGASWSQIGTAMGVTKQAAQKRFVPSKAAELMTVSADPFSRFTPRAARVLAAAGLLATGQGEPAIGPAHLATALLSEPEGIAAKVIATAGITGEQLSAALGTGQAPQGVDADPADLLELPFDEGTKVALKGTLKSALRLGHNYIGTEHLLLGLLLAGGTATEAFSTLGLSRERAEELIAAEIAAMQAHRETG